MSNGNKDRMDLSKKRLITPIFRVSFPYVFEPKKAFDGKGEPKYTINMLFPKTMNLGRDPKHPEILSLKEAAHNACIEFWGPDQKKWPSKDKLKNPFKDGDERADTAGYAGHIYIEAKSKHPPGLVDEAAQKIVRPEDFYAGCYARAQVIAYAYDTSGNKGVGFDLRHIQKVRDGKPFGGRGEAADVFEPIAAEDLGGLAEDEEEEETTDEDGLGF